jgi:hypothetical protein
VVVEGFWKAISATTSGEAACHLEVLLPAAASGLDPL